MNQGANLQMFQVFGAKALSGIGYVPETLADRSITIPLVRKLLSQTVEPFVMRKVRPEADRLRARLSAAVEMIKDRIAEHEVEDFPDGLSDRQREGWDAMFAIADLADEEQEVDGLYSGPHWGAYARKLAVRIHAAGDLNESDPILLLRHLRDIFDARDEKRVSTTTIITELIDRDDGPWP